MSDDVLRVVALTIACLFGLWTAVACRRAQYHGLRKLRRADLGRIIGRVFSAILAEDGAWPRLAARVRRLLARHLQAKRLVRRPPKPSDCGKHRHHRCSHRLDRLGPTLGLALHQALSPRHRLSGPEFRLRDHFALFLCTKSTHGMRKRHGRALPASTSVAAAGVSAVAIARLWQLRAFALQQAKIKT